jgi:hypothetical protein
VSIYWHSSNLGYKDISTLITIIKRIIMKNKTIQEATPTVDIAINKSRIKQYNKKTDLPTYYLKDGTEFQLELFNPTTDVILAKIEINNKLISQSGLILKPGQRVFLERYLDAAKKFKFETYEVSNTEESKAAIANNGDLKVLFYKESQAPVQNPIISWPQDNRRYFTDQNIKSVLRGNIGGQGISPQGLGTGDIVYGTTTTNSINLNANANTTDLATDFLDLGSMSMDVSATTDSFPEAKPYKKDLTKLRKRKAKKSIESGRVEMGASSDQEFTSVDKNFDYSPFHTIEYKILPVSQKPQTVKDVVTNNYCTQCGCKVKGTFRFCPQCGSKV